MNKQFIQQRKSQFDVIFILKNKNSISMLYEKFCSQFLYHAKSLIQYNIVKILIKNNYTKYLYKIHYENYYKILYKKMFKN